MTRIPVTICNPLPCSERCPVVLQLDVSGLASLHVHPHRRLEQKIPQLLKPFLREEVIDHHHAVPGTDRGDGCRCFTRNQQILQTDLMSLAHAGILGAGVFKQVLSN